MKYCWRSHKPLRHLAVVLILYPVLYESIASLKVIGPERLNPAILVNVALLVVKAGLQTTVASAAA